MRNTLKRTFTVLYTLAMISFLGLAFALVLAQIAGLVLVQGAWIQGASETLLRPAIVAAVVAGLLGYGVYNTEGTPSSDDEEEAPRPTVQLSSDS